VVATIQQLDSVLALATGLDAPVHGPLETLREVEEESADYRAYQRAWRGFNHRCDRDQSQPDQCEGAKERPMDGEVPCSESAQGVVVRDFHDGDEEPVTDYVDTFSRNLSCPSLDIWACLECLAWSRSAPFITSSRGS